MWPDCDGLNFDFIGKMICFDFYIVPPLTSFLFRNLKSHLLFSSEQGLLSVFQSWSSPQSLWSAGRRLNRRTDWRTPIADWECWYSPKFLLSPGRRLNRRTDSSSPTTDWQCWYSPQSQWSAGRRLNRLTDSSTPSADWECLSSPQSLWSACKRLNRRTDSQVLNGRLGVLVFTPVLVDSAGRELNRRADSSTPTADWECWSSPPDQYRHHGFRSWEWKDQGSLECYLSDLCCSKDPTQATGWHNHLVTKGWKCILWISDWVW